ncbi:N-acetylmuramoyl-L-alanine amidase [Gephyromycinifex aptenodytis]|uniref:N-acetylmuramoyl-L-alanine amidase n=1 Tax=Gephyromycinifex aptenodytis TaxID=2716227 RepID=UPI00144798E1|nr:N-acetylmuramoyl-L-alanine amidase [Gephyromycinifex aptenodytis]
MSRYSACALLVSLTLGGAAFSATPSVAQTQQPSIHQTRVQQVATGQGSTRTSPDRARAQPTAAPSTGGVRLAPTSRSGSARLRGRVIVIDPGHNGRQSPRIIKRLVPAGNGTRKACNTTGTASRYGPEHEYAFDVALRLARQLRAHGATVVLTRPNDTGTGPCVNERAAIGNRARADLVLSIHADGNTARTARGFHIITSTRMAGGKAVQRRSLAFAGVARDAYARTGMPTSTYTGGRSAITRRSDIAGLNLSTRPAIMLEAGNMRHPTDARLLADSRFRQRTAAALTSATVQTLGR